jgi:SAM-dependent methyltransferase
MAAERLAEGQFVPNWVRNEHLARYQFAMGYVQGKVVVDCACGDGTGSEMYAKAGAAMVHGFDISVEAIESASKTRRQPGLEFFVGEASNLPLAAKTADAYISFETIEHLQDDRGYLKEVVRVLKPDGVFICSTPNRAVTNHGKPITAKPANPFHVREYDPVELLELLQEHFDQIAGFGQNPQWRFAARTMTQLGRFLPGHVAVRIRQLSKLPRLLFDRIAHHHVKPANWSLDCCEYLVAVCHKPRHNLDRPLVTPTEAASPGHRR